jgi:hypothetical protein
MIDKKINKSTSIVRICMLTQFSLITFRSDGFNSNFSLATAQVAHLPVTDSVSRFSEKHNENRSVTPLN